MVLRVMTTFAAHVTHIVTVSSKEEVLWIYTAWVVALVTDTHAVGDCSDENFICCAVRKHPGSVEPEAAIPTACGGAFPFPAFASLGDVFQKGLFADHQLLSVSYHESIAWIIGRGTATALRCSARVQRR